MKNTIHSKQTLDHWKIMLKTLLKLEKSLILNLKQYYYDFL